MGKVVRYTPQKLSELPPLQPPTSDTLVTIVTPTIGRPDIERCIASVKAQTHQRVEHIIVADGTDAMYRSPVKPTAALGHCWSTPRTGPGGYATNVGWLLGHGEYLYTLPDDDWIEPNCIEQFIGAIGDHDFAFSQVEFSTPRQSGCFGKPVTSWVSGDPTMLFGNKATPDQFFHRRLLEFNMYFPTAKWEANKPGHDVDLLDGWIAAGAHGVFVDQILHHHTVNH